MSKPTRSLESDLQTDSMTSLLFESLIDATHLALFRVELQHQSFEGISNLPILEVYGKLGNQELKEVWKGHDLREFIFGSDWDSRIQARQFFDLAQGVFGSDEIQWMLSRDHFPDRIVTPEREFNLQYCPIFDSTAVLVSLGVIIKEGSSSSSDTLSSGLPTSPLNPRNYHADRAVLDVHEELERLKRAALEREQEALVAQQWLKDGATEDSRDTLETILEESRAEVDRLRSESQKRAQEIIWIQELVSVGRPNMDDFLMDAYELTQELRWNVEDIDSISELNQLLVTTLHTLKGNAGMYGFMELSGSIHELEDQVEKSESLDHSRSITKSLEDLLKSYATLAHRMFRVESEWVNSVGEYQGQEFRIPEKRLRKILERMLEIDPEIPERLREKWSSIHSEVKKFSSFPVEEVGRRLQVLVVNISKRLEKNIQLSFEGGGVYFSDARLRHIIAALGHIVRNSIDHGLEFPSERLASGKGEQGQIRILVSEDQLLRQISIDISDDGRGIDVDGVVARCVDSGALTCEQVVKLSDEERVNLIFSPGVSTKKDLSLFSGRGVGMYSAKLLLREQGGKITVETQKGKGTSFRIILPSEI